MSKCPVAVICCVVATALAVTAFILPYWHTAGYERDLNDDGEVIGSEEYSSNIGLIYRSGDAVVILDKESEACMENDGQCTFVHSSRVKHDPDTDCEEEEDETDEEKKEREECEIGQETREYTQYAMYGALGFALVSTILVILSNFGFLPNWVSMISIYIFCICLLAAAIYHVMMFPNQSITTWSDDDIRVTQNPGLSIWLTFGGSFFALVSGVMVNTGDDDAW